MTQEAKILPLDNLERRVFWYSLIVMLGLTMSALGVSMLISASNKSQSQVRDLSDRLHAAAVSPSEPPKT